MFHFFFPLPVSFSLKVKARISKVTLGSWDPNSFFFFFIHVQPAIFIFLDVHLSPKRYCFSLPIFSLIQCHKRKTIPILFSIAYFSYHFKPFFPLSEFFSMLTHSYPNNSHAGHQHASCRLLCLPFILRVLLMRRKGINL